MSSDTTTPGQCDCGKIEHGRHHTECPAHWRNRRRDTAATTPQPAGGAGEEWNPADGPPVEESLRSANYTIKTLIDANATLAARAEAAEAEARGLRERVAVLERTQGALANVRWSEGQTYITKIDTLASQLATAREALEKIAKDGVCQDGGGGLFYPMYDGDGEYIGEQNVDPIAIVGEYQNIARDALAALASTAPGVPAWRPTHQHRKGGLYRVLHRGQLTNKPTSAPDGQAVVYDDERGQVWIRPADEFDDGRFEAVEAAPGGDAGEGQK